MMEAAARFSWGVGQLKLAERQQTDRIVQAQTYADDDRGLPPHEVRGKLVCRHVPTLDYRQCWVGGVEVDPSTIRDLREDEDG